MTVKWSAFSAGGTVTSTDQVVGLQGGANVRWTFAQVGIYQELNLTRLANNGAVVLSLQGTGTLTAYLESAALLSWGGDLFLARDAANTLAQRNGTNAQTFRVYNTFTSSTNYERGALIWSSNIFHITSAAGSGGGTARSLRLVAGSEDGSSGGMITLETGGTIAFSKGGVADRWTIQGTDGHFVAAVDNTYDIGASGATRPRTIYAGTSMIAGGDIQAVGFSICGNDNGFVSASRGGFAFPADGVITLRNGANNDFGRLQFGGTTSSFPALKRSSAALQVRLADDSDFATLFAGAGVLSGALNVSGYFGLQGSITTETTDFSVAATTSFIISNRGATNTATLPAASSFPGRMLYIKTIQAQLVNSNASNVQPSTSATAGTAILPATDGAWAILVSNGTDWVIMAASPLV